MVELTRLKATDLADEALTAIIARPARAVLTTLGTVLGVAAFVAVLGLTATASGQIDAHFTALQATQVTVSDAPADPLNAGYPFTPDAEVRARAVAGVNASGVYWTVQTGGGEDTVSARPPGIGKAQQVQMEAASPGLFDAVHAHIATGRVYDDYARDSRQRVAVLGSAAAHQLGITRVDDAPAVFVNGAPFTVVGIIFDTARMPELLLSLIIPDTTARAVWGTPDPTKGAAAHMLVDTRLGAATQAGDQLRAALRPDDPQRLQVDVPPDPHQIRRQISTDLSTLFLGLAAICLVIGMVGIANTTLVAVMERVGDIGLRRALGARGRHICAHFLMESATLGLLGGLVGTSIGVLIVVATAYGRHWTAVIDPVIVISSPLAGAATGLMAGVYPAWRAAGIEPVEALRR
ncbi:ABC transporter permease [Streptomyces mirabilis]|uniref:ABC transporter permease n=1 Tax=Streptomyces mirabilis TaxID=68239 RepID=UPI0036DA455B